MMMYYNTTIIHAFYWPNRNEILADTLAREHGASLHKTQVTASAAGDSQGARLTNASRGQTLLQPTVSRSSG